jgi:hypothetical protein
VRTEDRRHLGKGTSPAVQRKSAKVYARRFPDFPVSDRHSGDMFVFEKHANLLEGTSFFFWLAKVW